MNRRGFIGSILALGVAVAVSFAGYELLKRASTLRVSAYKLHVSACNLHVSAVEHFQSKWCTSVPDDQYCLADSEILKTYRDCKDGQ